MLIQTNLTQVETVTKYFFTGLLIFLAIALLFCLLRAVIGPRIVDRIMAVNMMGTVVMVMIGILALLLKEGYLVDIALIYAMISFLAVVIITKVYMGIYRQNKEEDGKERE
jgi:multicomponent Na+:H+ antiporter subunit F